MVTMYTRDLTPWEEREWRRQQYHLDRAGAVIETLLGSPSPIPDLPRYRVCEVENRSLSFCEGCAIDYREYWDERWDDYYSSLM